ncbi:MAG: hypothetical protein JWM44_800 [Bacilli bacterium]|nr:hypothetical protein [Bacilli bacterium]
MFNLRKRAYALLLILFLVPAGCQNPIGASSSGTVSPSPTATGATETPAVTATPSNPIESSTPQPSANPTPRPSPGKPVVTIPSGGATGKVTAVRVASAGSGWIGGAGWIARTDDGGKHWQNQYLGSATFNQIFALNGQDAWAVTDKDNLLGTLDGGKHWATVGKVPNKGFLHFVSKNEAFSANARTTDGGKNWSTLPVPSGMSGDAYFHDKSNGWAVVQSNGMGMIERTTDGGKTWQIAMGLKLVSPLNGTVIRSAGTDDAWVEWIGDSGMTQTSYSLFHTSDGGKKWQTVLANSSAGGGSAPGFPTEYNDGPKNQGTKPGPLYVVDSNVAFMDGDCPACDKPNTVGRTTDGGKTWVNGTASFAGYAGALLALADANHGWWICTDNSEPSVLYTTSDGGIHWNKIYTFPRAKQAT